MSDKSLKRGGVADTKVYPLPPLAQVKEKDDAAFSHSGTSVAHPTMSPVLFDLPSDPLHSIASFLSPTDWAAVSATSHAGRRVGREVVAKVRMHGFRCATEVVTAWVLGQKSDARELAALYIRCGVPIYPFVHAHSYHTIAWRMAVEARERENESNPPAAAASASQSLTAAAAAVTVDGSPTAAAADDANAPMTDSFYQERYSSRPTPRAQDGQFSNVSYLEEKSVYFKKRAALKQDEVDGVSPRGGRTTGTRRTRHSFTSNVPTAMERDFQQLAAARSFGSPPGTPLAWSPISLVRSSSFLASSSYLRQRKPRIRLVIHRHLADQHLLGGLTVEDQHDSLKTPPFSLSADFYHPRYNPGFAMDGANYAETVASTFFTVDADDNQYAYTSPESFFQRHSGTNLDFVRGETQQGLMGGVMDNLEDEGEEIRGHHGPLVAGLQDGDDVDDADIGNLEQISPAFRSPGTGEPMVPPGTLLDDVDLHVYSSSSGGPKTDTDHSDLNTSILPYLQGRYEVYQHRIESLLSTYDSHGVEECIYDFWDEFFPHTHGIGFYDRHTAVPRSSCMNEFLTKPCPRSVGIVQCEIERIKISSKKMGVNVKGRLFPTYEYRLFIRDRRNTNTDVPVVEASWKPPRKDTVLMTSKNRGRNHQGGSGAAGTSSSGSKRGVNNYYLYLPQEGDIKSHDRAVNQDPSQPKVKESAKEAALRMKEMPPKMLLGRLQSNFIGTEFQIFAPSAKKTYFLSPCNSLISSEYPSRADDESEAGDESYASMRESPPPQPKRRPSRTRSIRRSLSRGRSMNQESFDEGESRRSQSSSRGRRGSWPSLSNTNTSRASRRAIADSGGGGGSSSIHHSNVVSEEEMGGITYTANLLGNRPRIMDVCIPRVSEDNVSGLEWRQFCEAFDEDHANHGTNHHHSMLSRFKQLQQRLENNPDAMNDEDGDYGLLALQNRPPWWNIELGAFVLNFGGRVSVASVKNFQLCERNDQDHIMLQFGRIHGRHSFTMDFQYPLTAVQAFAIAISSLQSKISFG